MTDRAMQVGEKVRDIVSTLFNLSHDTVTDSTGHNDIEAWDSVGHLNLILALQEEFSIIIEPEDFEKLSNVGAIVEYVIDAARKQNRL